MDGIGKRDASNTFREEDLKCTSRLLIECMGDHIHGRGMGHMNLRGISELADGGSITHRVEWLRKPAIATPSSLL